jgi:archaellin
MRYTPLVLVTLGLTGVAQAASAGELIVHTVSLHSRSTHEHERTTNYVDNTGAIVRTTVTTTQQRYNNVNPGVAWQFDSGVQLGAYYNSYREPTMYVAYEHMFNEHWGVLAGVGTGYESVSRVRGGIAALAAAEYKHQLTTNTKFIFQFIPPVGAVGVAHAAFAYSFK